MFLEKTISKIQHFSRVQFWKYFLSINVLKSNLENVFFEGIKCGPTDCVRERVVN